MSTIDFLFDLQQRHTFYKNGLNDLETFLDVFDKVDNALIEYTFTQELNLSVEEFLMKLQEDLENASESEITKLATIVESYVYSKKDRLLNYIRKAIFHYGIKHSNFDTQKFFKPFAEGIISEIEEDLYARVSVTFSEKVPNKDTLAENQGGFEEPNDIHHLILYPKNFEKQQEKRIFEILRTLYHEEFHMLVDEMQINPDCFKLDILDYQKTSVFRNIASNKDSFYVTNYSCIHEEAAAEIYGIRKACQTIKELNPSFSFSRIEAEKYLSLLWASTGKFVKTYKVGFFKRINQKEFINQQLDRYLPKNPDYIHGLLSRIYDKNGIRKSFRTLVDDYEIAKKERKNVPPEEINNFYEEILFEAYLKSNEQEKLEIAKDDFLYSHFIQYLKKKCKRIEEEIKELSARKDTSLTDKLKRKYKIYVLQENLEQIKNEFKLFDKGELTTYGL